MDGSNSDENFTIGTFNLNQNAFNEIWINNDCVISVSFLGILILIGVPGNLLVLIVYGFKRGKNVQRTIILGLGLFDFLVCTISLPFEIFDLINDTTFQWKWICKIFRTFNFFVVFVSSSIIQLMTIERVRKICFPLRQQMTTTSVFVALVGVIALCAVVAVPNAFIRGIRTRRFANYTGYDCTIADEYIGTQLVLYYSMALLITALTNILLVTLQYLCIIRQVYKHNNFIKKYHNKTAETNVRRDKDASTIEIYNRREESRSSTNKSNIKPAQNKERNSNKSTLITVSISVFFILSYIPTLTESVLDGVYGEDEMKRILPRGIKHLMQKMFAINHIVNPFIYGFFDDSFRKDCLNIVLSALHLKPN